MKRAEYAAHDAVGLARLVQSGEVSAVELAAAAVDAIEALNPTLNAVVELYHDEIAALKTRPRPTGPLAGVPTLIKDVFGHGAGRNIEFGSRLCAGMAADTSTAFWTNLQKAGLSIIGRSAAPEYSMAATTESQLYGNCSNPWKQGYSAGGSSGGAQAAVTSGMVPIAHGSDIGGSIRIPASWCGGVGFKPSRGRVSLAPVVDEPGFGYSKNLVQATSVRDTALVLDCVSAPEPGDPFVIPQPPEPYAILTETAPRRLRIGIVLDELVGVPVDLEVKAQVLATAEMLAGLGHHVEEARVDMGGLSVLRATTDLFFFGFDLRLDSYGARTGRKPGPDTLEPVIHSVYANAKTITPARYFAALAALNVARRKLGAFWSSYDIWLSPTTARVAEPWGTYGLSKPGVGWSNLIEELFQAPVQYTIPHNIMGTPAISLPLGMHSTGLPIGIQIAGPPADEATVLQVARQLEQAMPWANRLPPTHASRA
jgi:amidase